MKKCRFTKISLAFCLALSLFLMPIQQFSVQAAQVIATVHGTILSGTTSNLLLLSTQQGRMEIKLDNGTDTSGCKVLLPDEKISVAVAGGNDNYLHAVTITKYIPSTSASVDSSSSVTVTGTLLDKSRGDILYVKTAQGDMQIKLDNATNLSGCSKLVAGSNYDIVCARGSDAYMHALSISDATNKTASNGMNLGNSAYMFVSGKVSENTKENLLYLSTNDGEMQFVIDYNAETSKGMILTPGSQLAVAFYHGTDGYLHAVALAGAKSGSSANVDTSTAVTVEGTVDSKSTENILYLNTSQGTMELKLDAVRSLNNCKVLVKGKKIAVTCAHGSDSYLHALDITGK